MHLVQTFLRTTVPFSTVRTLWMFGSNVLGETLTTCIPIPPCFFAKPLRMMVDPETFFFPQMSQTLLTFLLPMVKPFRPFCFLLNAIQKHNIARLHFFSSRPGKLFFRRFKKRKYRLSFKIPLLSFFSNFRGRTTPDGDGKPERTNIFLNFPCFFSCIIIEKDLYYLQHLKLPAGGAEVLSEIIMKNGGKVYERSYAETAQHPAVHRRIHE